MKKIDLIIIQKSLSEITPYEGNAKEHPESQIKQIMASIEEFGNLDPIAIDENGVIIEGHGRYEALKRLEYESVPVIELKHLTDIQKKAYIIAHNKLTMNTGFNTDMLKAEFDKLQEAAFDLELTGFNFDELNKMYGDGELHEDDYELIEDIVPFSQQGDIWILGPHKIICGDSTIEETYKQLFINEKADLVVTDPPYNVAYEGNNGMKIENDSMGDKDFFSFLTKFYTLTSKFMKDGAGIYVWHADTEGANFRRAFQNAGLHLASTLIWVKNTFTLSRQDYHWHHEPCLYGWKDGKGHYFISERVHSTLIDDRPKLEKLTKQEILEWIKQNEENERTTIIRENKPSKSDLHPTMKPIRLMGRLIKNSSQQGWLVFDPFMGSGSTMIAADQLGRKAYGVEYDPKYMDNIVKRYCEYREDQTALFNEVKCIRKGKEIDFKKLKEDMQILDAAIVRDKKTKETWDYTKEEVLIDGVPASGKDKIIIEG